MSVEKELAGTNDPIICQEADREERKFRHRIGYMAMVTGCTILLSFVFIIGWSVIVHERDIAEGPAGKILESLGSILGIIF